MHGSAACFVSAFDAVHRIALSTRANVQFFFVHVVVVVGGVGDRGGGVIVVCGRGEGDNGVVTGSNNFLVLGRARIGEGCRGCGRRRDVDVGVGVVTGSGVGGESVASGGGGIGGDCTAVAEGLAVGHRKTRACYN